MGDGLIYIYIYIYIYICVYIYSSTDKNIACVYKHIGGLFT